MKLSFLSGLVRAVKARWFFLLELPEGNRFENKGAEGLKGRVIVKRGTGNTITIGSGTRFDGSIEILGTKNTVVIGDNCHFKGDIVVKDHGQTVTFGDHSTCKSVYILCQEGCNVRIGRWCMLSRDIEIRTTDAHSLIDRQTGKRLNMPASIAIGDHVWVGVGAIINKGSRIASDSVVGAMAFVNSAFDEEGVVIAGVPAKVVRRGVTWNRGRKKAYSPVEMDAWRG